MRPILAIVRREVFDLGPVIMASIPVFAVSAGVDVDRIGFPGLLGRGLIGGVLLGIVQGRLDRRRRGDSFLLHRPQSVATIHAARTLAGLGTVLFLATGMVVTYSIMLALHNTAVLEGRLSPDGSPGRVLPHLAAIEIALIGAGLLAAWSALRLVTTLRAHLVLPGLLLPAAVCSAVSRTESPGAAAAVALVAAAVLTGTQVLDLAGEKP